MCCFYYLVDSLSKSFKASQVLFNAAADDAKLSQRPLAVQSGINKNFYYFVQILNVL